MGRNVLYWYLIHNNIVVQLCHKRPSEFFKRDLEKFESKRLRKRTAEESPNRTEPNFLLPQEVRLQRRTYSENVVFEEGFG
jgi:hypothetical protein